MIWQLEEASQFLEAFEFALQQAAQRVQAFGPCLDDQGDAGDSPSLVEDDEAQEVVEDCRIREREGVVRKRQQSRFLVDLAASLQHTDRNLRRRPLPEEWLGATGVSTGVRFPDHLPIRFDGGSILSVVRVMLADIRPKLELWLSIPSEREEAFLHLLRGLDMNRLSSQGEAVDAGADFWRQAQERGVCAVRIVARMRC